MSGWGIALGVVCMIVGWVLVYRHAYSQGVMDGIEMANESLNRIRQAIEEIKTRKAQEKKGED